MKPKASVCILTKNVGDEFEHVLRDIFNQSFKNFEVIIIDSGSRDKTLKTL